MNYCDVTLATPQENLACDEALLDLCENGHCGEVLRFWEPQQSFVVAGYGNHISKEVNVPLCEKDNITILRRCTGGGAVLQGPGVLNYCLILRADEGPCQTISTTNQYVLKRLRLALSSLLVQSVELRGQTDLAIGGLKFCGNSQRRKKRFLIFHGSFLLDLDLDMVERTLPMPSKEPDYRRGRAHRDFLINLEIPPGKVREALREGWAAHAPISGLPWKQIAALVNEKYSRHEWNFRF